MGRVKKGLKGADAPLVQHPLRSRHLGVGDWRGSAYPVLRFLQDNSTHLAAVEEKAGTMTGPSLAQFMVEAQYMPSSA